MTELSEPAGVGQAQSKTAAETPYAPANAQVLHFMFEVQRVMLEEVVFAGIEGFDRARTETHLLAEFVSKTASAHSAGNLKTLFEECSLLQMEVLRRDSERLFKHGGRMIETAAKLLRQQPRA